MIVSLFFSLVKGTFRPFKRMVSVVPGVSYVNSRVEDIKDKSSGKIKEFKGKALRGGVFILLMGIILWLAIFGYIAFYYTYMPALTHVRPVHLQFKTCDDAESTICSFPSTCIQLTKRQQFLMVGQRYKIYLTFEMPESEANRNLGMFMVYMELKNNENVVLGDSCRPVMLRYRSQLMYIIKTLALAPLMILGTTEEKQIISVEMFSDFEEDENSPLTNLCIEIKTKKIELYSSTMQIQAHFTGLRYLMFHWPILSAIFGVGINLSIILFIFLLSWYHLFNLENNATYYTQVLRDKICSLKKDDKVEKKALLNKTAENDDEKSETETQKNKL